MNKRYYLTLLVLFPFMLSSQISVNSKIRSFQLGLNTGFGYNRWEGLLYPGSAETENGVSIVNSLDFLYRMNRFKIGIGLGLDQYFFSLTHFLPVLDGLSSMIIIRIGVFSLNRFLNISGRRL